MALETPQSLVEREDVAIDKPLMDFTSRPMMLNPQDKSLQVENPEIHPLRKAKKGCCASSGRNHNELPIF
jgi:hypothetical protein